jgi:Zn-dependent protease/CBS domain-containing protein
VRANVSWLILVALIVTTLAMNFFPQQVQASPVMYWGLALLGAAGLFASLIAHEMCHSLVALHYGMPVSGITLFVFGGVSQLEDEPPTAGVELLMAGAGPLASIIIGSLVVCAWLMGMVLGLGPGLMSLLVYLWMINFILAAFNLLPAFPLDGGRILRSMIWAGTGNMALATRAAGRVGWLFGWILIAMGAWALASGEFIMGIWIIIVGLFLQRAAAGHRRMVVAEQKLEGHSIKEFMTGESAVVPAGMDLATFVQEYVLQYRFGFYPVADEKGQLAGVVTPREMREVDQERWRHTTVRQVMRPVSREMTVHPEAPAAEVLRSLRKGGERRLIVAEEGKPRGIVSVQQIIEFLDLAGS